MCASSGRELCAQAQQTPAGLAAFAKGTFLPLILGIVRGFTSPSPLEALQEGCCWLGVPYLIQWDPHPPPEVPVLSGFHTEVGWL